MADNLYKIDSTVLCTLIIKIVQTFDDPSKNKENNKFSSLWSYLKIEKLNNNLELYAGVKNRNTKDKDINDKNQKYLRKSGWLYTTNETKLLKNKRSVEVSALDVYFSNHKDSEQIIKYTKDKYPAFCSEDEEKITLGRLFYNAFCELKSKFGEEKLLSLIKESIADWKLCLDISEETLSTLCMESTEYETMSYNDLINLIIRNAEINCIKPLSERDFKTINIERIKFENKKNHEITYELNIQESVYLNEIWNQFTNGKDLNSSDFMDHLIYSEAEIPENVKNICKRNFPVNFAKENVIAFDVSQSSTLAAVYRAEKGNIEYYKLPIPEILISNIYQEYNYVSRSAGSMMFKKIIETFMQTAIENIDHLIFSVRGRVTYDGKVLLNENIKSYVLADISIKSLFSDYANKIEVLNNGNARVTAESNLGVRKSIACISVKTRIGFGYINEENRSFIGENGAGCELGDCPYDSQHSIEEALKISMSDQSFSYDSVAVICHALRYIAYLMAPKTIYFLDLTEENSFDLESIKNDFIFSEKVGGKRVANGYDCDLLPASFGKFQAVIGCLKYIDIKLQKLH